MTIFTGVITISDRVSRGEYRDLGGPALKEAAVGRGWQVLAASVVADDIPAIQEAVRTQINQGCRLVLTTGGTGVAHRDVTPEAVRGIADRELPGFGETMRRESLKITQHAILSRLLAASIGQSLVVCLPGKPDAAVECLGYVANAIPHCLEILAGTPNCC